MLTLADSCPFSAHTLSATRLGAHSPHPTLCHLPVLACYHARVPETPLTHAHTHTRTHTHTHARTHTHRHPTHTYIKKKITSSEHTVSHSLPTMDNADMC